MLAANQGLYNGFLAAGLVWGLFHPNAAFAFQIKVFFLLCVIVAGAYGAATVSQRSSTCRRRPRRWPWSCSGWPERLTFPSLPCIGQIRSATLPGNDDGWPSRRDRPEAIIGRHNGGQRHAKRHSSSACRHGDCDRAYRRHLPVRRRNTTPAQPTPRSRSARPCRSGPGVGLCQHRQDAGRLSQDDQRAGRHQRPQAQPHPV